MDDRVDLFLLAQVLLVGLIAQLLRLINLLLQLFAVVLQLGQLVLVLAPLSLILNLFVLQDDHVHLSVLFDFLLRAELLLCHLLAALLVQIGRLDFHLQLFEFVGLGANFFDFAPPTLVCLLLGGESARESLLHADHVDGGGICGCAHPCNIAFCLHVYLRVVACLPKSCHFSPSN